MGEFRVPDTGLHILILGCMSSGKSTVLNALLGRGAFPAGNRATTAQIFRIVHDPWCENNVCRNPSESDEWHPLTLEEVEEICTKSITSSELEMYRDDGSIYRKRLGLSPDRLQIIKI